MSGKGCDDIDVVHLLHAYKSGSSWWWSPCILTERPLSFSLHPTSTFCLGPSRLSCGWDWCAWKELPLLPGWIESNPFAVQHHRSVDLVTYLYHSCKASCRPRLPLPPKTGKVYKPPAICTLLLVATGGALVTVNAPCPMHCSHLTQFIPVGVSRWQWYMPPVILLMYNHSVLSQPTVIFTSMGWGNNESAIHKLSERLGQEWGGGGWACTVGGYCTVVRNNRGVCACGGLVGWDRKWWSRRWLWQWRQWWSVISVLFVCWQIRVVTTGSEWT